MPFVVYAIFDQGAIVRYIGVTGDFERRTKQHLRPVGNSRKDAWCRKQLASGLQIRIETLLTFPDRAGAQAAELSLIHAFRPTLNTQFLGTERKSGAL